MKILIRTNEVIQIDIQMNNKETLAAIRELIQGFESLNRIAGQVNDTIRALSHNMQNAEGSLSLMQAGANTLTVGLGLLDVKLVDIVANTEKWEKLMTLTTNLFPNLRKGIDTWIVGLAAKTTATTLAAGAVKLLQIALNALPIFAVIAGIQLLIGAIQKAVGWLFNWVKGLNLVSDESKHLKSEQERLQSKIEDLNQSIKSNQDAFKQTTQDIDNNAAANRYLADEVKRLAGIENKTAEEKARLNSYIQMLNDSMEGLNLQYDEESNKLNMSIDLIHNRIDAMHAQAKANAAQERLTEILKQQMEVEFELEKINKLKEDYLEKDKGIIKSKADHFKKTTDLNEEERELLATQADLAEQYDFTAQIMIDSMLASADAAEQGASRQKLAYENLSDNQRNVVDKMVDYWTQYRDSGREMFSQIGDATKLYTYVTDEEGNKVRKELKLTEATHEEVMDAIIENMRHNRKAMEEWSNNLTYIADEFCAEFAGSLRDLGPEAAGYVHAMANGCEDKLRDLVKEFHLSGESATSNITNAIDEGYDEVTGMVAHLGTGMHQTLRQEVEGANFKNIGETIPDDMTIGVEGNIKDLNQAVKGMVNQSNNVVSGELDGVYHKYGNKIVDELAGGIDGRSSHATMTAKNTAQSLINMFRDFSTTFQNIGQNAMDGLNAGLNARRSTVLNTARSIANDVTRTIRKALDINSPSRVMRDQVGKFIPEGIAVGIDAESNMVMEALHGITDDMLKIPKISPEALVESSRGGLLAAGTNHSAINHYNSTNNEGLFDGATIIWKGKEDIRQTMQEIAWITQTEGARM